MNIVHNLKKKLIKLYFTKYRTQLQTNVYVYLN